MRESRTEFIPFVGVERNEFRSTFPAAWSDLGRRSPLAPRVGDTVGRPTANRSRRIVSQRRTTLEDRIMLESPAPARPWARLVTAALAAALLPGAGGRL